MNKNECLEKIDKLINCYLENADDSNYSYNKTISLTNLTDLEYEVFERIKTEALANPKLELDMLIDQILQTINILLDDENAFRISMGSCETLTYICEGVRIYLNENGVILIGIELKPRCKKEKGIPVILEPFVCISPGDEYYDEFIKKLRKPFDKYFDKGTKLILKK